MRRGLVLLVLPLALAACGGSSHNNASGPPHLSPAAYVRHAARLTSQAPSEHMVLAGKIGAAGFTITLNGAGDFSNTAHSGALAATFSGPGLSGKIDEVMDGTAIYMSSPLFASSLPAGKTWMKLDLQKLGKSQGINFSSLMSRSPTQAFQQLEAAGTVTELGSETINGVATTHYRIVHLDITKLPQGSKIAALDHPNYGPIDVWIGNADGYIYRETVSISYSVSGQTGAIAMTTDFSKFGEAVHVSVPPASETVDGTSAALSGATG